MKGKDLLKNKTYKQIKGAVEVYLPQQKRELNDLIEEVHHLNSRIDKIKKGIQEDEEFIKAACEEYGFVLGDYTEHKGKTLHPTVFKDKNEAREAKGMSKSEWNRHLYETGRDFDEDLL